ncbi:MAG: hypothetical protein COZ32_10030 [Nitrospirae bacterium CG_4_10_14_3_um_filter_53_41]|nr:MAG: hypothetical protein COW52_00740 [Nitrospirae bacterium CG17_big_fil_post_rev_8_21_14_2_50_50_9]PIX85143.1 MAG: hypothetical protein COZ32_10030 [Nitrospirae bacterium CG_4_10_14_3_um_filter_53_41]
MESASPYEINERDIRGVRIYRGGIVASALAFVMVTVLLLFTQAWGNSNASLWISHHEVLLLLAVWMIVLGTGASVLTIHLYIRQFHLLLKILFGIGAASVMVFLAAGFFSGRGFLQILYQTPYGTFGFGFVLAALCGITVKEAFCFGMPEAVLFAVATPLLILGHIFDAFRPLTNLALLCAATLLICIFAVRKVIMRVDLDIGDKSVYMQKK